MYNRRVVYCSDRGLPKHTQVYVEHPSILASQVKKYMSILKKIRKTVKETYPNAHFKFIEVDDLDNPILNNNK